MKTKNNTAARLNSLVLLAGMILPLGLFSQWTEQNTGISTFSAKKIDCINGTNCFLSGSGTSDPIMKTVDGENWTDVNTTSGGAVYFLQMFNADTCYVVRDLTLCRTFNGGDSWTEIPMDNNITPSFFINTSIGYGSNGANEMYKTVDKGDTWDELNIPNEVLGITGIFFLDEMNGFISTGNNTNRSIYKTVNGGQNWTLVFDKISTTHTIKDIQMVTNQIGFACGLYGMILKTTDGGNSWSELSSPVQEQSNISLNSLDFINTNSGYVVGNNNTILKTIDGGTNWIDEAHTTSYIYNEVSVSSMDTIYISGPNQGRLLKNSNANLVAKITENEQEIGKLYPNPVSNILNIDLQKDNCRFELLDAGGKVVFKQQLELSNHIDLSGLSSGLYQYRITQENGALSTGKISKN